ncbi:MAG: GIY-YIG nuclease family protein [Nitrospinae bacterium]|nr:GIY-YIG nuclease family protein [Nitrospinota bacterium]
MFEIQTLADSLGGIFLQPGERAPASGAYALVLRVEKRIRARTGSHGLLVFGPGLYLYAGRAARGLPSRLARHLRRNKPVRWHIDRLTNRREAEVQDIIVIPDKPGLECEIVRVCLRRAPAWVPIPHFGNGDCREGCPSHLLRFEEPGSGRS